MNFVVSDPEKLQRVLEGRTIIKYESDEMALWERGPGGLPVFSHPQVPCVQCGSVILGFDDGIDLCIQTNLNVDDWSLIVTDLPADYRNIQVHRDAYSIYREAALDRFPTGRISDVAVSVNPHNGYIRAISIMYGQDAVSLVAAEFEEQYGPIRLVLDDESILFFPHADGLRWAESQVAKGNIYPP